MTKKKPPNSTDRRNPLRPVFHCEQIRDSGLITRFRDPLSTIHLTRIPALYVGRREIADCLPNNPGVYILTRPSNRPDRIMEVYVGETGNCSGRVTGHIGGDNPDYHWAFVISSENVEIGKTDVRVLEYKLYTAIVKVAGIEVTNAKAPVHFEVSRERASFLARLWNAIVDLTVVSGFPMGGEAVRISADAFPPAGGPANVMADDGERLVLRPGVTSDYRDYEATAVVEGSGLWVQPGSQMRITPASSFSRHNDREYLEAEGSLEPHPEKKDRLVVTRPVQFESRQLAASALVGANVQRLDIWVPERLAGTVGGKSGEMV